MAYRIVLELDPPLGPEIPAGVYEFGISARGGNRIDSFQASNVFNNVEPGPYLYCIRRINTHDLIKTGVVFTNSAEEIYAINGKLPMWGDGVPGADGLNGYSPVFGFGVDGERLVLQVEDWIGGTGPKPPSENIYIGLNGFTRDVTTALNLKGARGTDGRPGFSFWGFPRDPTIFDEPAGAQPLDMCLNTVTGTIWKKLGSGRWLDQPGLLMGPKGKDGDPGGPGANGWSPAFKFAYQGENVILQIVDWVGGQGQKPAYGNVWLTTSGTTNDPNFAVNLKGFRGQDGRAGTSWFSGNYVPDPFNVAGAQPLDLFLHSGTGDVYKQLGSGRWLTTGANLKGPGTNPLATKTTPGLSALMPSGGELYGDGADDTTYLLTTAYADGSIANPSAGLEKNVFTWDNLTPLVRMINNDLLQLYATISQASASVALLVVATYDQAKNWPHPDNRSMSFRVSADPNPDNNGTYDWYSDSQSVDKLEKRIYSS